MSAIEWVLVFVAWLIPTLMLWYIAATLNEVFKLLSNQLEGDRWAVHQNKLRRDQEYRAHGIYPDPPSLTQQELDELVQASEKPRRRKRKKRPT